MRSFLMVWALAADSLFLGLSVSAQSQKILPAQVGDWNSSSADQISPAEAERVAGQNAPILREYGLSGAEHRIYVRGAGQLEVTVFRMHDPSAAYGAYSFLRTADMDPSAAYGVYSFRRTADMAGAQLAECSSLSRTRALVLKGNLILDVTGADLPATQADLHTLATAISRVAQSGSYPTLWQHLPVERFVDRSDRYVLGPLALHQVLPLADGDWLGFSSSSAEAEVARYRVNGQEITLLLADYPTPQIAAKKMRELATQLNLNGANPSGAQPPIYARRVLTTIALVAGAHSSKAADYLLGQIGPETELTWNEPSFSFTEPGIGPMVAGAFIGTGIICLFTLIAALAFGGVRLLVKKLLPGRVFDRDSSTEVLQLGLSSKPIEAKDFYSFF
jgi:hypothetical protein